MKGMRVYPINDYQYVLEVCGRRVVITYSGKKRSSNRKMLKIVRVLMFLASIIMFTGFMIALGTIGHTEMLDEMHMVQDLSGIEVTLRCIFGLGASFMGAYSVKRLYEIENILIQRLES